MKRINLTLSDEEYEKLQEARIKEMQKGKDSGSATYAKKLLMEKLTAILSDFSKITTKERVLT